MIAAVVAVLVAAYVVWRLAPPELRAEGARDPRGPWRSRSTRAAVLSALPDPKQIIEDVAKALGPWTYAVVGLAAFLETGAFVGLVAPVRRSSSPEALLPARARSTCFP
jgi:hypothetical protein